MALLLSQFISTGFRSTCIYSSVLGNDCDVWLVNEARKMKMVSEKRLAWMRLKFSGGHM